MVWEFLSIWWQIISLRIFPANVANECTDNNFHSNDNMIMFMTTTTNFTGFDDISNELIKICKLKFRKPLTYRLNLTQHTGVYPDKLKLAIVTPVHKTGACNLYEIYRAFRSLCSVSKIYELKINLPLSLRKIHN